MPTPLVKQPVLLISHDGMLGRAWLELLPARGIEHETVTWPQIDYTKPETIGRFVPEHVGTVINCAAYTAVDDCEEKETLATQINGHGVGDLADRCKAIDATLVHYSTDYVFSGEAQTPYRADEPHSPVNAYGRGKAVGEQRIVDSGCEHLIVRTSWLYAPWANNFVRTMARLTAQKDQLKVVDDQRGRPTSAEHLAATTLALLERGAARSGPGTGGIYHVTDGGECSWHAFAVEIARLCGQACDIQPCTTDEFPRPAKRPAYSVLDLSKTEALLGPMPDWTAHLADVIRRLEPLD